MPERTDFDTVRKIAFALPGVEERSAYGSPVFTVRGRILAGIPAKRSEVEPGSLGVSSGFDDRAALLAAYPDVYYVTDHHARHNVVLVRLSLVNQDVLRDLLGMAYKFVTGNAPARKRR